MTINIALGWWIAPAIITAVCLVVATSATRNHHDPYFGSVIVGALSFGAAAIVILVTWLIWSLAA